MNARFRIVSAARSHTGHVRAGNEDNYCTRPERGMWVVADGMGGHAHGERASAETVEAIDGLPDFAGFEDGCEAIARAIRMANARVWSEGQARGTAMGTTVVALLVRDGHFAVLWVGDSRAYLLRDGTLFQISRDHSQVQDMVDRGLLEPDAADRHPMSHVLMRAVGAAETVEVDVIADTLEAGDVFLLCSDGLTACVADAEIAAVLESGDVVAATEQLERITLERGAPDNVTVIAVMAEAVDPAFRPRPARRPA